MIVYKAVDYFSQKTGEKLGSKKEFDFQICDFTGEKIGEYENPNSYIVNYNDNDPCFGDGEGEEWLFNYKAPKDDEGYNENPYLYDLFAQSDYVFKEKDGEGKGFEVFGDLIKAARKAKLEIYSLDHLLRWSRGKMLEKVITEGTYTIDQFSRE